MGKLKWQLDDPVSETAESERSSPKTEEPDIVDGAILRPKVQFVPNPRVEMKLRIEATLADAVNRLFVAAELMGKRLDYQAVGHKLQDTLYVNGWHELRFAIEGFDHRGYPLVVYYIDSYLDHHWKPI